jgi:hypothetical protein
MEMKKILALGVIILFIGVAVAPSINQSVVKASQDDDLVEVTTQACGIKGFGNTTVKLTREQFQNLQQYLSELCARLNKTQSQDEILLIVKEAVVELNDYGLLPKHLRINEVQRLILAHYLPTPKSSIQIPSTNNTNSNCLILGRGTWSWAVRYGVNEVMKILYQMEIEHHLFLLQTIRDYITWMQVAREILFPFFFGTALFFIPYHGYIVTKGVEGIRTWDGIIIGGFPETFYRGGTLGVKGFVGLHFTTRQTYYFPDFTFFLGSAMKVNLGTEFPG